MNRIEQLAKLIVERIPGIDHELIAPQDPERRWILECEHQGFVAVIGFIPKHGFALSIRSLEDETAYGIGLDEVLESRDPHDIAEFVIERLQQRQRTNPPRQVLLREIRRQLGLSQVELANRLGVNQPAVSKLERREDMALSTLKRLVQAMGGELELWVRFPDEAPLLLSASASEEPAAS